MYNTFTDFDDFENTIYGDKPVLIEFFEEWSQKHKELDIPEFILYYKCNVSEQDDIAEWCDITDLPTFICFQNGVELFALEGSNKVQLKKLIDNILPSE
jgi:thioredoxin-like negative regulator of GroEL